MIFQHWFSHNADQGKGTNVTVPPLQDAAHAPLAWLNQHWKLGLGPVCGCWPWNGSRSTSKPASPILTLALPTEGICLHQQMLSVDRDPPHDYNTGISLQGENGGRPIEAHWHGSSTCQCALAFPTIYITQRLCLKSVDITMLRKICIGLKSNSIIAFYKCWTSKHLMECS